VFGAPEKQLGSEINSGRSPLYTHQSATHPPIHRFGSCRKFWFDRGGQRKGLESAESEEKAGSKSSLETLSSSAPAGVGSKRKAAEMEGESQPAQSSGTSLAEGGQGTGKAESSSS
jgi:hypothetical protein